MQLLNRATRKSQSPSVEIVAPVQPTEGVSYQRHRGVYAQWQQVDGKLTCQWFNNPD